MGFYYYYTVESLFTVYDLSQLLVNKTSAVISIFIMLILINTRTATLTTEYIVFLKCFPDTKEGT